MKWLRIVLMLSGLSLALSAPAATIVTIEGYPIAGPALAIGSDGLPVIAYSGLGPIQPAADENPRRAAGVAGLGAGILSLAKCRDIDCSESDWGFIQGPNGFIVVGDISMAIAADGNPAIAFHDGVDHQLKLVKCTTLDCTGSPPEFRVIDPGPHDVGAHVALAFDADGNAVFAYQDSDDQALLLARCMNPGCGNVDIVVLDDSSSSYGAYASIAVGENNALAVVNRFTNSAGDGALKFFLCTASPCSITGQLIDYLIGHPVGSGLSMTLRADYRPLFSYHDDTDNSLRFAGCTMTDCSGADIIRTVDTGGSLGAGAYSAIAARPDLRPVIAYQKPLTVAGGADALVVAECDDIYCNDSDRFQIDQCSGSSCFADPAIAIGADGGAAIAYFDRNALAIKFAKCDVQGCRGPDDRLFADGFD